MPVNTGDNRWATSNFIVAPTIAEGAGYTTVSSAVTAASAAGGGTILIKPGIYTEDFTLPDAVNLVAYTADAFEGQVEIVGKITRSAGSASISGIRLTTNGDYCLSCTAGALTCTDCYFNATDNTAILNSGGDVKILGGEYQTADTFGLFDFTSGSLRINYLWGRTPTSGNNTQSGGALTLLFCQMTEGIFLSNAANAQIFYCRFPQVAQTFDLDDTSVAEVFFSHLNSGSSVIADIEAGARLQLNQCNIEHSGSNAVTGAGTLEYTPAGFGVGNAQFSVTTQTPKPFGPKILLPANGAVIFNDPASAEGVLGTNSVSIYEEGTFTPVITGSSSNPTVTYTTQLGWYQLIGNWCQADVNIEINTFSGGTGAIRISLPFAAASDTDYVAQGAILTSGVAYTGSSTSLIAQVNATNAYFGIRSLTTNAADASTLVGSFAAGDVIRVSMRYKCVPA